MMQILKKRVREREERTPGMIDPFEIPEPESRSEPSLVAVDRLRSVCSSKLARSTSQDPEPADDPVDPDGDPLQTLAEDGRDTGPSPAAADPDSVPVSPVAQDARPGEASQDPEGDAAPMERRFPNAGYASAARGPVPETGSAPSIPGTRKSFIEAITERQKPKTSRGGGGSTSEILGRHRTILSENNSITEARDIAMTATDTVRKTSETLTEDLLAYLTEDNTTILAEGMTQRAETETDKNVIVYGTYTGKLKCRSLIIGPCGSVSGEIDAETIHVEGLISGDISSNRATFTSTSMLDGSLTCLSLQVEHGARVSTQNTQVVRAEDLRREAEQGEEFRRYPTMDVSGSLARRLLKNQNSAR